MRLSMIRDPKILQDIFLHRIIEKVAQCETAISHFDAEIQSFIDELSRTDDQPQRC